MNIDLMQIFIQAVNFFVVMGALSYLLYNPILKVLDERSKRIQEGNRAAETAIQQREAIDEMKAKAKKELEKEKAAILKEATQDARSSAEKIVEKAHDEAKTILGKAKDQANQEKSRMLGEMKGDIVEAIQTITATVIPKTIGVKDQVKLIDTELENILKAL